MKKFQPIKRKGRPMILGSSHQPQPTWGERGYLALLKHILENGYGTDERTGTGTFVSDTPHQLHFPDVGERFPLFTTKKVSFNMLACEMLWFIEGSTNTNRLAEIGSPAMKKQWDKWANDHGDLGPVYGEQWRRWFSMYGVSINSEDVVKGVYYPIDQLKNAIKTIKDNPNSRRIIVSAWNPSEIENMALPPCHLMYQFTCEPLNNAEIVKALMKRGISLHLAKNWKESIEVKNVPRYRLHLHMTQRSCDMFLGVPFNVAQYALLLLLVAQVTNTVPGGFTWTGVNCHIYKNHSQQVETQLERDPLPLPKVTVAEKDSIDDFTRDDITLTSYEHHPAIKAPVAV